MATLLTIVRLGLLLVACLLVVADLVILFSPSLPNHARFNRAFYADSLKSTPETRQELDAAARAGRTSEFIWMAILQIGVVGVVVALYSGARLIGRRRDAQAI